MPLLEQIDVSRIQLVMFDLDGTLYEDTEHFRYYADRLKNTLPEPKWDSFERDYEAVESGKHALKIGRVYDLTKDWVLVYNDGKVKEVYEWSGQVVDPSIWKVEYEHGITIDMECVFSIGDSWWVPNTIARHYGADPEKINEAFLATREYMMTPGFKMNPIPRLDQFIQSLTNKGIHTILVTNSPEIDSRVIVDKLGLSNLFTDYVFMARKPVRTKEVVENLCSSYHVSPEQVLSIGDNFVNEIVPVLELGGQAIHINLYRIPEEDLPPAARVNSMTDIIRQLRPEIEKLSPVR